MASPVFGECVHCLRLDRRAQIYGKFNHQFPVNTSVACAVLFTDEITQSMMTHESHHSGLRPLLRTQASPATVKSAIIIPYAMKPLPL